MQESEHKLPRRKSGPKPLAQADRRDHCVSVRLNSSELAWLDDARKKVQMQRGEYLRSASLGILPPTIPEINRTAWVALARTVSNLNQFQRRINEGLANTYPASAIKALENDVQELRRQLLGIRESGGEDEGEN